MKHEDGRQAPIVEENPGLRTSGNEGQASFGQNPTFLGELRKKATVPLAVAGIATGLLGAKMFAPAEKNIDQEALNSLENRPTSELILSSEAVAEAVPKVDLTGIVPEGQRITDPVNVPADLQKDFVKLHPGYKLLYVSGDTALTDMPFRYENTNAGIVFDSFGGSDTLTKTENGVPAKIAMVYKSKENIQGSEDYYIKGLDPITREEIKVRVINEGVSRNSNWGKNTTCFYAFDLSKDYQPGGINRNDSRIQMRSHTSEDVLKTDEIINLVTIMDEKIGDPNASKLFSYTGIVDELGIPEANVIFIPKIKNVEETTNLYARNSSL